MNDQAGEKNGDLIADGKNLRPSRSKNFYRQIYRQKYLLKSSRNLTGRGGKTILINYLRVLIAADNY